MERRALIAVIISVLILVLYQEIVMKRWYPATHPVSSENATPPGVEPPAAKPEAQPPSAQPKSEGEPAPVPQAKVEVEAAEGTDVVVDTDLYHAVFTTAGARLKSLELKHYKATVKPDSPPLQLVQYSVSNRLPLGVSLVGTQQLSDAGVTYRADTDHVDVSGGGNAVVTFTGELSGATIRKRIDMRSGQYLWGMDVEVTNPPDGYSEVAVGWDEGFNPAGAKAGEVVFDSIRILQAGKMQMDLFPSLEAGKQLRGDISWVAFSGHYFLAALVPNVEVPNEVRAWAKSTDQVVEAQLLFPPKTFSTRVELYVGPKEINLLEEAGHSLRRAVDLGWFTFLALPMLQALRFLHHFTGNYGVAIIILTVIVKVLFYPLTRKSFESMRAMQKLQPEMAKIRERLQDKPEEMNREVMELYKRHKVNPLGGCLPMVLQIPVFVGLYNALSNAIELRHAPFIGWITDLSAPDRLGTMQLPFVDHPGIPVMTLLMGISMFVQQWMTPSAADPQQQRVMMIMPIMFTFMFINFPAGLTLYWLVNNVLTIAQQYAMTRKTDR